MTARLGSALLLILVGTGCCGDAAGSSADGTYDVVTDCPGGITHGTLVVSTVRACPLTTTAVGAESLGLPPDVTVVGDGEFDLSGAGSCTYDRVGGQGVLFCQGSGSSSNGTCIRW